VSATHETERERTTRSIATKRNEGNGCDARRERRRRERVNSRSADEAQHNRSVIQRGRGKRFIVFLHLLLLLLLLLIMATSSSDGSCTAPADFQLSSELEDASSRLSMNLQKCPLCHNSRRIFYCRQCVQNGDFIHSNTVYSERYV